VAARAKARSHSGSAGAPSDAAYLKAALVREVVDFIQAATFGWTDFKPRLRDRSTLDTSSAEVRLSDGTTIGIAAAITARKRTEEAAARERAKDLQLAGHTREVLWNTRPQGPALP
jgi:hypothetical protein